VMHLVRLIDDLLDVSRIARGKVQLQLEPLDVRKCIEQAVETHAAAADEAGHRLHVTLPDHPLVCMADPVRVIQIVSNLIANSVRYTPPGGDIHVSALAERGRVLISVRDNGVGISPELLPRIFDTFVQERIGDAGLGLGLTLVKQVATLHNGTVAVRSEGKGLGSEFEVSLPERAATVESREPTAATMEGASVPLRVLVVEDQVDISAMTQDLLQGWGHEVHVAYTGFDGVALAKTLRPDVVLLDIGLPDIDGFAVANQIRAGLGRATARLVAVTGFGNADYRARAQEAGFDDYLVKPAPPDALRLAVERGS
jgi:CheY-like chemotaxis protein/two-component sensor histidine kinase